MRILFTDEHPLMHKLPEYDVISDPKLFRSTAIDPEDPDSSDYRLKPILLENDVDIVVLVNLWQVINGEMIWFHQSSFRSWRSSLDGKLVIAASLTDPFVFNENMKMTRRCIGKIDHCNLYVTQDMDTAIKASKYYRVAHFDGENADPFRMALKATIQNPRISGDSDSPYI